MKLKSTIFVLLLFFTSSNLLALSVFNQSNTSANFDNPFIFYEAEDGQLFNGATIQSCDNCSGGQQVGDLGGDNLSYFTYDIEVEESGTYNLFLSFSSGDPRTLFISVNDGTPTSIVCNSADWGNVAETFTSVELADGVNTIKFYNDEGFAPNIDGFSIVPVSLLGTFYEAEDGVLFDGATIQSCDNCSGGEQVGDLGGDNQSYFTYDISADQAGMYDVLLYFSSGDPRSIFISSNDGSSVNVVCDSGNWGAVGLTSVSIELVSGLNTLKFFNDEGFGPNIDGFFIIPSTSNSDIFEAEDGQLSNGAEIQSCDSCSGGQQVGNLGGDSQGFFTYDVEVEETGLYNLTLFFSSGDPRSIFISANDGTPIEVVCDSGDWSVVGQIDVEIELTNGVNTIKFFNDEGFGPNIDGFTLELISLSIVQNEFKNKVKPYPNPTTDQLFFTSELVNSIEIYTIQGIKVSTLNKFNNGFNLSNLAQGAYLVRCFDITKNIIGNVKILKM